MTVKELKQKLDNFGDEAIVKVRLEEVTKYGQYDIQAIDDGTDHENGAFVVEIRI